MRGLQHQHSAYLVSLAAMPNQQLLQVISRSAQRDERPATRGTQVLQKRIGTYTCINKAHQKGPELNDESNVTQVTHRSSILQIMRAPSWDQPYYT